MSNLIEESPSLKSEIDDEIHRAYKSGLLIAATKTNMGKAIFPETCPFSLTKLLDSNFFPNSNDLSE